MVLGQNSTQRLRQGLISKALLWAISALVVPGEKRGRVGPPVSAQTATDQGSGIQASSPSSPRLSPESQQISLLTTLGPIMSFEAYFKNTRA